MRRSIQWRAGLIIFFWTLPAFLRARGEGETLVRPTGRRLLGLIAALGLLAISTALPALLPVPTLPAPRGPYFVGTFTRLLVDESRREIYSEKDEPRRLMMQVWYPAQPAPPEAKPAAWMPDAQIVAPEIAEYIGLPRFFLNHLAYAKSAAYENLPPARESGPIRCWFSSTAGTASGSRPPLFCKNWPRKAISSPHSTCLTAREWSSSPMEA